MKILIACEFSGVVRESFKKKGHDAWSCDILPTEIEGNHIQDNVLNHLNEGWDMMIAHPPCTYLCNSGVCWFYKDEYRWEKLKEAKKFFYKLYKSKIQKICIENPIPHKYGELPPYDQIIQPFMFGHMERKATCLWLKNLPRLIPTNYVKEEMMKLPKKESQRIHYMSPSNSRGMERSRTFTGIAEAMAERWG